MNKDPIWKLSKYKKYGALISRTDRIFELLFRQKNFKYFCFALLLLGDVRYQWQATYLQKAFANKMSCYNITTNRKKDEYIIKIKRKTEKQIVAEMVAEKV